MYAVMDDNGRITETDHPINILSGKAVGPLGTPGQVLAVASDGQNLAWVSAGAGTVTGSGANTQVAFWNSSSSLSGSTGLIWDGTHFVVGTAAVVGFTAQLQVVGDGANAGFSIIAFNTSATGPFFGAAHANGTLASPTATASGDAMLRIFSGGYYTSGGPSFTTNSGKIELVATETFTSTAWGSNWAFYTTKTGTTTLSQVLLVSSDSAVTPGISVTGSAYISHSLMVGNGSNQDSIPGSVSVSQTATLGGGPVLWTIAGAHTGLAAEGFDVNFNLARTVTFTHSSVPATQRAAVFQAPTYATSSLTDTITTSATLAITDAPTAGTGITITNPYAFWVQAGGTLLAGGLNIGAASGAAAGRIIAAISDAGTSNAPLQLTLQHFTSATPLAGFGNGLLFQLHTSTNATANAGQFLVNWVTPTNGSQMSRYTFYVYDVATNREAMRMEGTSGAAMIGFLGAAAVVRPASTDDLRQALINLGLYTTGGATPLNLNGGAFTADSINVGTGSGATSGLIAATASDAGTANVPNLLTLGHNSSNTPLAGFGQGTLYNLKDSSTADTPAAYDSLVWVVPTHSSTTARRRFFVYDTAQREYIRAEASGSAPMIGFLGAAAIIRPISTTDLRVALINLGLYTTGGASPLDLNGGAFTAAAATVNALTVTTTITSYNGVSTAGNGVGAILATVDLTAQAASIGTTTLYATPAAGAGIYRLSWYAKVTRAATSTCTIGPLTVVHTDATDSVNITQSAMGQIAAGTTATSNSLNATSGILSGTLIVWAKASTNITYAFTYASSGATTMQYELHLKLEYLG